MPPSRWRGVDHVGLRLVVGALGVFWGVLLLALFIGAVAFVGMMLWP